MIEKTLVQLCLEEDLVMKNTRYDLPPRIRGSRRDSQQTVRHQIDL